MAETSDHLKILIEKPYLRPYFYDNTARVEGDVASLNGEGDGGLSHAGMF